MTRTGIALFTTSLLFTLGADCPPQGVIDEGFHVAADGTVLQPGIPATVEASADALPAAEAAVAWWNAELDCEALELVESNADILVVTGLVPAHGDPGADGVPIGLAEVDYAEDGTVLGGTITIAYEIAYDEETAAQVAAHESPSRTTPARPRRWTCGASWRARSTPWASSPPPTWPCSSPSALDARLAAVRCLALRDHLPGRGGNGARRGPSVSGLVAQLVEHLTLNQVVGRSSRPRPIDTAVAAV